MSYPKKTERNKDLVKKRLKNPKKWTYGVLASHFGITRGMVVKLFYKYKDDFK